MLFASRSERAEEIRGLINAGNHRGARAIRGGKDGEPRFFNAFGPKVLAGIDAGRLPDTIADRAIHVLMQRKGRTVRVERVRRRMLVAEVENLRDKLYAWAHQHVEQLADYDLPAGDLDSLTDRAEEGWEPLLGIAALAGESTYQRAVSAALALAEHRGADRRGRRPQPAARRPRQVRHRREARQRGAVPRAQPGRRAALRRVARRAWHPPRRPLAAPWPLRHHLQERARHRPKQGRWDRRGGPQGLRLGPVPTRLGALPGGHATRCTHVAAGAATSATALQSPADRPKRDGAVAARTDVAVYSGNVHEARCAPRREPQCAYPDHRSTDWARERFAVWVCGVCHPPPSATEGIIRRYGDAARGAPAGRCT